MLAIRDNIDDIFNQPKTLSHYVLVITFKNTKNKVYCIWCIWFLIIVPKNTVLSLTAVYQGMFSVGVSVK